MAQINKVLIFFAKVNILFRWLNLGNLKFFPNSRENGIGVKLKKKHENFLLSSECNSF